ncbi:MAG: substrate-binding domain-containing protein [Vallitaleaceae bacterium]|nr:substrate-binding domain-containing protein [Vallitaleaceae bacterium]
MKNSFMGWAFLIILLLVTGCQDRKSLKEVVPVDISEVTNVTETSTSSNITEKITEETIAPNEPLNLSILDYPKVDGSTATIPLSLSTFMTLTGASQEVAEGTIMHTKTANAYTRLIAGEVDLLIVYEAPDSIKETLKTSPVKLNIAPIGKDALVFITNEQNPVSTINETNLVGIYSGKVTNWQVLGGEDKEIIAFQRPDDSGSQTLMKGLVMKEVPFMDAPSFLKPQMMGELIDVLAEYDNTGNALGYSVYYYAKNMYEQPNLKFLAVNDILPTNETIQEGSYPYIKEFYAVIREGESTDSSAFKVFEWLQSDTGQQLVTENGYVSID